jgi:hypothetical protein
VAGATRVPSVPMGSLASPGRWERWDLLVHQPRALGLPGHRESRAHLVLPV